MSPSLLEDLLEYIHAAMDAAGCSDVWDNEQLIKLRDALREHVTPLRKR